MAIGEDGGREAQARCVAVGLSLTLGGPSILLLEGVRSGEPQGHP